MHVLSEMVRLSPRYGMASAAPLYVAASMQLCLHVLLNASALESARSFRLKAIATCE